MQLDLSDRIGAPAINWGDMLRGQEPGKPSEWVRVSLRVLAVCLWPHDAKRRNHFIASWAATSMDAVMRSPPPAYWPSNAEALWPGVRLQVKDAIEHYDLLPHGNWLDAERLTNDTFDMAKWEEPWQRVATVMMALRSMDVHHRALLEKGPSLRKAYDVVDDGTSWSRQQLERSWEHFSGAAHLIVAAYVLAITSLQRLKAGKLPPDHPALLPGFYFFRGLPILLSVARDWEKWLLTLRVHPGKPLLTPNQIWRLPPNDGPPTEVCIDVEPLEGKMLDSLLSYRARKGVGRVTRA